MIPFIVLASVVVGVLRFFIPGHELSWFGAYEAFAHILVGWLLCMGFRGRAAVVITTTQELPGHMKQLVSNYDRSVAWFCLIAITVIEVIMFMNR